MDKEDKTKKKRIIGRAKLIIECEFGNKSLEEVYLPILGEQIKKREILTHSSNKLPCDKMTAETI